MEYRQWHKRNCFWIHHLNLALLTTRWSTRICVRMRQLTFLSFYHLSSSNIFVKERTSVRFFKCRQTTQKTKTRMALHCYDGLWNEMKQKRCRRVREQRPNVIKMGYKVVEFRDAVSRVNINNEWNHVKRHYCSSTLDNNPELNCRIKPTATAIINTIDANSSHKHW